MRKVDLVSSLKDHLGSGAKGLNKKELRKEGKIRGLKGEELDKFVEHGVANQIAGNAAGAQQDANRRGGTTGFDALQQYSRAVAFPDAMRFAPAAAQIATGGALQPTFNITLPPGSDPKDFVTAAKTSFDGYWSDQLRRAKAGAGK